MKLSLNWLRDFVDWTGTSGELTELLTRTGIEVADVVTRGADFPNVVIGQILESNPHPNADRLSVCRVDDGSGAPRQIVCGAKNYKAGDKAPVALPGAVLPGDFKIKTGKLRGVESAGMLCSAKELRLAEDSDGLLILPASAPVGLPLSAVFPSDTIFEIEITPNRGDWLSHFGVAREVAAFSQLALTPPATVTEAAPRHDAAVARIEALAQCPFYSLRRIRGVTPGPGPQWLRDRIEAAGLRAINNVVDVTNYVMLELGQPLHAFDAAKLSGEIVVRIGKPGEKLPALDGREYLTGGHLVIADRNGPLALAGIMGGEHSAVGPGTREVLLESALFDPATIRRSARALGLHSDSSHRFERGVSPGGVLAASARAAALIVETAGGESDAEISCEGAVPAAPDAIGLRHARCRALLGADVSDFEITDWLGRLGLGRLGESEGCSQWNIPAHRLDLTREVDLIEEVARMAGIDRIGGRLQSLPATPGAADAGYDFEMGARQQLVGSGFSEARTSTLVSAAMLWRGEEAVRLRNPLGEDQAFLRTSLAPGLLDAGARNIRHGAARITLFEIGRTFHIGQPEERRALGLVLTGTSTPVSWRSNSPRELDWHDAKGIIESLAPGMILEPGQASDPLGLFASIQSAGNPIGWMGQLTPPAARAMDAAGPVIVAELHLTALQAAGQPHAYVEIPRFPGSSRDFAIVCPLALPYSAISGCLTDAGENLLHSVSPFDIFTDPSGEKLPADKKSVAISLTFQATGRTLTNEEVNDACERLKDRLRSQLGATFRE